MNYQEAIIAIFVMGLITYGLRALPFVFAKQFKRLAMARLLGRYLPPAIMLILTLTSLHLGQWNHRDTVVVELIPLLVTIGLHVKWRHPLVSILGGTLLHILLKQYL